MRHRSAIVATVGVLVAAGGMAEGCSSGDIPIARENASFMGGEIDAGTGRCGSAACQAGELCCAGGDPYCSPTCMRATSCPVYGRPCVVDGGTGDGGGGDPDAPPARLQWYTTCGGPVCQEDASALPPGCPQEGTACSAKGQTCGDGAQSCGVIMVCDDHDPKAGGCPRSSAKFKEGIHYLNDSELVALHDETLDMRLTTYRYQGPWANGSDAIHLGFIVEDQPQSLSVDRGHDRVDLYGYVSMVVATMQVQDKQIRALREELAATRSACAGR
jgi:hypothetical protein